MDTKAIRETLHHLDAWRRQVMGLALIPPEVQPLLDLLEEIPALERRKADFQREIAALAEQDRRDRERFAPLRAEVAEWEEKLRSLKEGYEAFRRTIGVGV